jgi:hypothetical protein
MARERKREVRPSQTEGGGHGHERVSEDEWGSPCCPNACCQLCHGTALQTALHLSSVKSEGTEHSPRFNPLMQLAIKIRRLLSLRTLRASRRAERSS